MHQALLNGIWMKWLKSRVWNGTLTTGIFYPCCYHLLLLSAGLNYQDIEMNFCGQTDIDVFGVL
jgi:hypothetical protein